MQVQPMANVGHDLIRGDAPRTAGRSGTRSSGRERSDTEDDDRQHRQHHEERPYEPQVPAVGHDPDAASLRERLVDAPGEVLWSRSSLEGYVTETTCIP
jgi:hypothetical protein